MTTVPARAWRPAPGRSRATARTEQDKAAGGPNRRAVRLPGGEVATAAVALRGAGDGVRAFLTWREDGRTRSKALGPVRENTRLANLTAAWEVARAKGLVCDTPLPQGSWASSYGVRASMRGNKGRDTAPERELRSLLHARGLRYRVSARPLPSLRRTADVVFPRARVAVFVDGCYWHGCPEHHRAPSTNSEFWRTKIATNQQRDAETTALLEQAGWTVIRCWEHEDADKVAQRVVSALGGQEPGSF
ncbi:very short patch repair endonuclease [Actinokineospora sp. G85]|uniref:very short patch repair endonuclease n=1 Tax=Actinokineospora sp. G85 TaxID=3406626 RepID=UPI003C73A535